MKSLGAQIGALMAQKQELPNVTVQAPDVNISVDAKPIAAAMRLGADENAKAMQNAIVDAVATVSESVGESVGVKLAESLIDLADNLPGPADFSSVEAVLALVVKAISGETTVEDMQSVVRALDDQTRAVESLARAQEAHTDAIRAERSVSDANGRVVYSMKVGK